MTSNFEALHPRAAVLDEQPGVDDAVSFDTEAPHAAVEEKVGRRVRKLIENGRWAVRRYNDRTNELDVIPAKSGAAAHTIAKDALDSRELERTDRWTDYASDSWTFRVYRPVTEPLPYCAGGCGKRMLPDEHDYWSGNDGEDRYCDSTWCGKEDPFAPRDEPVDARDTAVSPWWENR